MGICLQVCLIVVVFSLAAIVKKCHIKDFSLIIRECYYPLIIGENQKNFLVKDSMFKPHLSGMHTGMLLPKVS